MKESDCEKLASLNITSPPIVEAICTVKQMLKRMKQPDLADKEFPVIYERLSEEFPEFFQEYSSIFPKVIDKKLGTIMSILYYRDKFHNGTMTEAEIAQLPASKYMTPELKAESDARMMEMRALQNANPETVQ
jgi:hypothetical protein